MLKAFFILCVVLSLLGVIRPDIPAKWTYEFRKKDWNLTENSMPMLMNISRYGGLIMFLTFCYLLATTK